MTRTTALVLTALLATSAAAQRRASVPYAGRWDLTLNAPDGSSYPSWIEVSDKDGTVVVLVVGREGSLHGSANVRIEPVPSTNPAFNESAVVMGDKTVASQLSFTTLENFGQAGQVLWQIQSTGNKLTGTQKRPDGVEARFTGERAPLLKKKAPVTWSIPQPLFNGADLTGWLPANTNWKAQDGELANERAGINLRTERTFSDFKLHIEYNCPSGGNSGVYLRGRYEVQIEYEPAGKNDLQRGMGSIYGFLAPSTQLPARPGEWESYDITLVGRTVTVVRNGVTLVDQKEIPGITGGALDSHESLPGPIYLQGDHTAGMKFRNITIALPERT